MTHKKKQALATRCIHGGQHPDPSTGAIMPPIYATSTYVQSAPGVFEGYEYSRTKNPTRSAFEACLASLESGCAAFAFASGMAAITTVMQLLSPGDEVIVGHDIYGGTFRLLNTTMKQAGLVTHYVDMTSRKAIQSTINSKTRLIFVETPSNPMLHVADLEAIVELAKKSGCLAVCDNTFATPCLQQPIALGMDLVVHSATKYLNGHSDIIGGAVVVGESLELAERIAFLQNTVGAIASPFDSFLALRGLKTLHIRMERHCESALSLAHWLESHPRVRRVIYPGLSSHPQHALASKQMTAFGGMISLEVEGHAQSIADALGQCDIFSLAESLGGVESLIEHPGIMTHASVPADIRKRLGISDQLIRLSVGIEALADLQDDLDRMLSRLSH